MTKTNSLQEEEENDDEDNKDAVSAGEEIYEHELEQIKQAKINSNKAWMNHVLESTSLIESSQQELWLSKQDYK